MRTSSLLRGMPHCTAPLCLEARFVLEALFVNSLLLTRYVEFFVTQVLALIQFFFRSSWFIRSSRLGLLTFLTIQAEIQTAGHLFYNTSSCNSCSKGFVFSIETYPYFCKEEHQASSGWRLISRSQTLSVRSTSHQILQRKSSLRFLLSR